MSLPIIGTLCGWIATYGDGTTISQYGDRERSSEEISRKNLRSISLIVKDTNQVVLTQKLKPGQKLIYRVRSIINTAGHIERLHILGWEQENVRHISFIHENNMIIIMGDYDTTMPWYYPIEKLDHDDLLIE